MALKAEGTVRQMHGDVQLPEMHMKRLQQSCRTPGLILQWPGQRGRGEDAPDQRGSGWSYQTVWTLPYKEGGMRRL